VIAVLYDVHGNLRALEAVVADARAAGASEWVLGGDYAVFGAWPAETVAALRELEPATWIRGNVDRWAGGDAPEDSHLQAAVADCRAALGDALADELGELPAEAEVAGARFVHASPVSDMRSFGPEPGDEDDELVAGTTQARLVFGHTHVQFRRPHGDLELVNPGSVGVPLDGDPRAAYALIDPDDGSLELRRVPYDTEAAIARLREAYGEREWAPTILRRLETQRP
jgi:predicted phosphodiesterase